MADLEGRGFVLTDADGVERFRGSQRGGLLPRMVRVPVAFDTPSLNAQDLPVTAVNQGAKTFTFAGDQTLYFDRIISDAGSVTVNGSTGNDRVYTPMSSSFAAGSTSVVVAEAIPSAVADGFVGPLAGGLTLYAPSVGDVILVAMWSVATAWNDTAASGFVLPVTNDPFVQDLSFDVTTVNAATGAWSAISGWDYRSTPLVMETAAPIVAIVGDGNTGGAQSSTQGEGEIILLILSAA